MLFSYHPIIYNYRMEGKNSIPHASERSQQDKLPVKFDYFRPPFLELTPEVEKEAKDHGLRRIITPSNVARMPWHAGYSEVINSGKTLYQNEDQASILVSKLVYENQERKVINIPYVMFNVFDGHAGTGAALFAANNLHIHIKEKLDAIKQFLAQEKAEVIAEDDPGLGCITEPISTDLLVSGALEQAFVEMDDQIRRERQTYQIKGGCTAMTALFLQNKIYVSNAGDCRAIILLDDCSRIIEVSMDFTPETDRQRLQTLAYLQPQLLGKYFGRIEFQRRLRKKDTGQRVLYRDRGMTGWAYCIVSEDDVNRVPMISGHGKRARLLATIGTTRGLGDHDLEAPGGLFVKPFLTPVPQIQVFDLSANKSYNYDDLLILASDGLWERLTNEEAQECVKESLKKHEKLDHDDPSLYKEIANDLVLCARGTLTQKGWRTQKDQIASGDDITCFVIPLMHYSKPPTPGCLGEVMIDPLDNAQFVSGATNNVLFH